MKLSSENERWLNEFRTKHGRAPRILHMGNIANNAYKNAKLLNDAGLDCDVICYDYYHLMGCPEWEDADFDGHGIDHFSPDWTRTDLHGYKRPLWFAQGPLTDCINYLVARRSGQRKKSGYYWRKLGIANNTFKPRSQGIVTSALVRLSKLSVLADYLIRCARILATDSAIITKLSMTVEEGRVARHVKSYFLRIATMILLLSATLVLRLLASPLRIFNHRKSDDGNYSFDTVLATLVGVFNKAFPLRPDRLSQNDAEMYRGAIPGWRALLAHYDVVQAYATDPIIPMICNYRPYIGFEHGTLRDFTLGDSPICRLTSLAYNQADHVFITNGDCLEFARKIGVERCSPMLHPIEEERIASIHGDYADLHRALDADYLFLCPIRHDWKIKGTDVYIRALPMLKIEIGPRFKLIMTRWGNQLEDSEQLVRSLRCADLVHWIDPLPRKKLVQMQKSVDVVFDQIALPHFGATAPEALACGVPVIMSYDPASTRWIIPEAAPILSARSPEEVVSRVKVALSPDWRGQFQVQAQQWFECFHSSSIVVNRHFEVYRRLVPI